MLIYMGKDCYPTDDWEKGMRQGGNANSSRTTLFNLCINCLYFVGGNADEL